MSLLFLLTSFLFPLTSVHSQTRQQWRDSLEVLNAKIGRDPNNLNLHLLEAEANINLEQWDYALAGSCACNHSISRLVWVWRMYCRRWAASRTPPTN